MLILTASCQKGFEKLEEDFGVTYSVSVDGKTAWDSNKDDVSVSATMEHSILKVTLRDGAKEVVLYAKEFVKGKYTFDAQKQLNKGVYKDGSKTFEGETGGNNYIEIKYIHTDSKTFDGVFNFVCTNGTDTKTVHGTWANVKRQ